MVITETNRRNKYTRTLGDRSIAYVESNLHEMLDRDFFPIISEINYKSKAWVSICKKVNNLISSAIKVHLNADYNVTYNRKAGCKCGCSPGFIIKRHGKFNQPRLEYTEVYMDVKEEENIVNDFKSQYLEKFKKDVMVETLKNKAN